MNKEKKKKKEKKNVRAFVCTCLLMGITKFRGAIDMENVRHVVGEEEAIWVLKLVLPYLNEFLLKLRALFCGDPATTMKVGFLFLFSIIINLRKITKNYF